jgi:hypothetical protein
MVWVSGADEICLIVLGRRHGGTVPLLLSESPPDNTPCLYGEDEVVVWKQQLVYQTATAWVGAVQWPPTQV